MLIVSKIFKELRGGRKLGQGEALDSVLGFGELGRVYHLYTYVLHNMCMM